MRKRSRIQSLSLCVGGLALTGLAGQGLAQTLTGKLSTTGVTYGAAGTVPGTGALATQTVNTGFGDSTAGDGTSSGGSELDAAYGTIQGGNLYLFLAGNFENNGNLCNIFIDDGGPGGQNTLTGVTNNGFSGNMTGSVFSPGFNANLELDVNDYQGTMYVDQYVMTATTRNHTYLQSIPLAAGIGSGTLSGISFAMNNTNAAGVNGNTGTAATASDAQAVNTGLEIGIPLADLNNTTGNIEVMADINSGGDTYLSNQFLPGLPVGSGNVGAATAGVFNFSTTPGEFFTVMAPVAVPNGNWIQPNSGSWNTSTNWSNSYVPTVAGDTALFSGATQTSTVTLDGPHSVGNITFTDSSDSYTLAAGTGGGVLTLDNGASPSVITDYAGTHTISAPVVLNSNTTVSVVNPGDSVIISGNITGNGGLTVINPGDSVVVVSGTNSYGGGTTVQTGNLQLGSAGALPANTALSIGALDLPAGTLDLNGYSATVKSITVLTGPNTVSTGATANIINTSATAGTATLTYAGSNANPSTFSGNINDRSGSGGGTTALSVTSGSLTLTGNNSYGGTTTVANGAYLAFSSATSAGTTFPAGLDVANNGSLVLNDSVTVGNITGSGTTTVTANQNVQVTTINQAGGVVNDGNLNIFAGGTIGRLTETGTAGAVAIAAGTLELAPNGAPSSQSVLYIAPGAVLDITNNKMFINYGSGADPIADIASWIANGYYNIQGVPQIISSLIGPDDAASGYSYGIGYADSADPGNPDNLPSGTIEIMFTLLGDANLDGTVNTEDFTPFSQHLGQNGAWDEGDFNYDGTVNSEDFTPFSANIDQSAIFASQASGLVVNGLGLANVPEPASLGFAAVAGLGLLARRRRSSRDRC